MMNNSRLGSVQVCVLNFFVTLDGLTDQLLNIVVTKERPELSEMKNELTVQSMSMRNELQEIEDKILLLMSNAQGNILEDEELIDTLSQSKATSVEIATKVQNAATQLNQSKQASS